MSRPPGPTATAARHAVRPPSPHSAAQNGISTRPQAMDVNDNRTPPTSATTGPCPGATPAATAEGTAGTKPKSNWKKCWDYTHAATYYKHTTTEECRWASAEDPKWMEATDRASGQTFLEHIATGEIKWKTHNQQEAVAAAAAKGSGGGLGQTGAEAVGGSGVDAASNQKRTIWEELKEPATGFTYYFSWASQSSQWHPPVWIDYYDQEEKSVYYVNTRTRESRWEKPVEFVAIATECQTSEKQISETTVEAAAVAGKGPARFPSSPSLPHQPPDGANTAAASVSSRPSVAATRPPPAAPTGRPKRSSLPPPQQNSAAALSGSNFVERTQPPGKSAPGPPAPSTHATQLLGESSKPPPSPPKATRQRISSVAQVVGGRSGASATSPKICVPAGLPPPPPRPRGDAPVGRWSPRGSVPPPPGPPPAENLPPPPPAEAMAVNSSEEHEDEDDVDNLTAGTATG